MRSRSEVYNQLSIINKFICLFRMKIREEIASLKRQYQQDKLTKDKQLAKETEKNSKTEAVKGGSENHYINDFLKTKEKYTEKTKSKLKGQLR